jgi:acyl-CoA synthetase (AMP-forming)/AMP-acid ligase II
MIYEAFLRQAGTGPDGTAVRTTGGDVLTYGELADHAERTAAGLEEAGVRSGDTVATWLDNGIGYVVTILALCRLGVVHLPISRQADGPRIQWLLDRTRAGFLVTEGAVPTVDRLPRLVRLGTLADGSAHGDRAPHPGAFRLLETSGSTGTPRLVSWRQDDLLTDRRKWIRWTGLSAQDRVCCMHPLDVAHGTDVHLFPALLSGAELILVKSATPETVLDTLAEHGATVFSALPRHYEQLVEVSEARGGVRLPSLRLPLCGGAYLSGATVRRAEDALGIHIRRIYGSTEFGIVFGNLDDAPQEARGMRPLPGVEVRLDPLDARHPQQGEIVARSSATSVGYHDDSEATARAFVNGWYRTGDVAELGLDGEYRVVGRTGDAIAVAGRPLFAPVVEEQLAGAHPVDEVVVVAGGGSDILVLAVPSSGADPAAIREGIRAAMTAWGAGAARIHVVDTVPHTPVGKADRPRIRRMYFTDQDPVTTAH